MELDIVLEPYHFGRARVTRTYQSCEYGKPEKLLPYTEIEVEAIAMKTVSRLMGQSSVKDEPVGAKFSLSVHDCAIENVIKTGKARYVYSV
jgi:hypothetical protein